MGDVHLGHLTRLPAAASGALRLVEQLGQVTTIGIKFSVLDGFDPETTGRIERGFYGRRAAAASRPTKSPPFSRHPRESLA
jgi:hypothetical protein